MYEIQYIPTSVQFQGRLSFKKYGIYVIGLVTYI